MGDPHIFAEGQPAEPRGRFALGPRFVPNRSARFGTGAEPPHPREPAARCELRQLAVRKSPVMRLHQEEFCLTPSVGGHRILALRRPGKSGILRENCELTYAVI